MTCVISNVPSPVCLLKELDRSSHVPCLISWLVLIQVIDLVIKWVGLRLTVMSEYVYLREPHLLPSLI